MYAAVDIDHTIKFYSLLCNEQILCFYLNIILIMLFWHEIWFINIWITIISNEIAKCESTKLQYSLHEIKLWKFNFTNKS